MKHRVVFFNEFDLFKNNSAGITVRDLFGNDFCYDSLQLSLINGYITAKQYNTVLLHKRITFFTLLNVIKIIRSKDAELIYTTGTSVRALLILSCFKSFLRLPILIHYFDNWRERDHRFIKNRLIRYINGGREKALVISDSMKEYYEKRYGGEYKTLMVGSKVEHKSNFSNTFKKWSGSDVFSILYCGGFHLDRYKALLEFEKELSKFPEHKTRLIIATFKNDYDRYGHLFNQQITRFYIDVPHDSVHSLYDESNALLFVEPAPDKYFNFLKYSMSTKIPEYLASGIPIICYSDSRIAPYRYFYKTGSAILATNPLELESAIARVLNDDSISTIVENAQIAVEKDFNSITQRSIVTQVIDNLISENA